MKTIKARNLMLCLILIGGITGASAQSKGITLTGKDWMKFYYEGYDGIYNFKYDDAIRRKTFNSAVQFIAKNKLTEKEYAQMNIAKSKHPTLRAIPMKDIAGGSTIAKTDAGSVRLIYASKKNAADSDFMIYIYVFTITPEGKYIDSLYGGAFYASNPNESLVQDPYMGDNSMYVQENKIKIIEMVMDDESLATIEIPYIITPELKFKKVK